MSLLDFLRKPFSVLETISRDEIDSVVDTYRELTLSQNKTTTDLIRVAELTSYWCTVLGSKEAQVISIQSQCKRFLDQRKATLSQEGGFGQRQGRQLEEACLRDEQFMDYREKYDICTALLVYLQNKRADFERFHYTCRHQVPNYEVQSRKVNH